MTGDSLVRRALVAVRTGGAGGTRTHGLGITSAPLRRADASTSTDATTGAPDSTLRPARIPLVIPRFIPRLAQPLGWIRPLGVPRAGRPDRKRKRWWRAGWRGVPVLG